MFNSNKLHHDFNEYVWSKLPNAFNLTQPLQLLQWAQPRKMIKINLHHTFLILDMSALNCLENAIVFDSQLGLLKTIQTTRELMRQYWHQADYWHRPLLEQIARVNHITASKIPFIKGDVCMIPLGASTQKSTSWFSSHLLTAQVKRTAKQTELSYGQRVYVTVAGSLKVIQRQVKDSQQMQAALRLNMATNLQFMCGELPATEVDQQAWGYGQSLMRDFAWYAYESKGLIFTTQEIRQTVNNFFGKI
ncbi:hypothetical protein RA086_04920 [Lactiplantibacillus sp. WILCCON 0030]|uniref:Uncharacterized protein n=1 Tax=Lactiplantibacillus brownii TaxID=3069269 RepID=A0ABU1A7S4_9LACO|nr:hypothetical protein [Lactiplantibacillus brownii]MDQ7936985.1 hypothetical protein [Lactiplantibacillus brownii]